MIFIPNKPAQFKDLALPFIKLNKPQHNIQQNIIEESI